MITVEVTFTIKSPILSTFGNRSKDPGAVQSAEWGVQLCTFASQRDPASVKWFISKNDAIGYGCELLHGSSSSNASRFSSRTDTQLRMDVEGDHWNVLMKSAFLKHALVARNL